MSFLEDSMTATFHGLCLALLLAACGSAPDISTPTLEPEADDREQSLDGLSDLSMSSEGFSLNQGLAFPPPAPGGGVEGLSLTNGILYGNGVNLTGTGVLNEVVGAFYAPPEGSPLDLWIGVDPPNRKRILKYLVECALPQGVSVRLKFRGVTETLGTGVGNLGSGLQTGPMSVVEEERVSACLLARVNARRMSVTVHMVGPFAGFDSSTLAALDARPVSEAAFYGNLFRMPVRAYSCVYSDYADLCYTRACLQPDGTCNCGVITPAVKTPSTEPRNRCLDQTVGHRCTKQLIKGATTSSSGPYFVTHCTQGDRVFDNVMTARLARLPMGAPCRYPFMCSSGQCVNQRCR